jgi:hypothetical protein
VLEKKKKEKTDEEEPPGPPTDLSAERKKEETPEEARKRKIEEGLKSFSDSLKGVQAPKKLQPPQIGAPGVHAHSAISGPNLATLLTLVGQPGGAGIAPTQLGRLLAMSKL